MVVDDSALARRMITDSLANDPEIVVVGTAMDPFIARDKILSLKPDVVTLDIEMPRMDGLTFLKLIMRHRPMPVIVMSSLTNEGSAKAIEALQCGAVDVMGKPSGAYSAFSDGAILAQKIKAAAGVNLSALAQAQPTATATAALRSARADASRGAGSREIILLGASTGGTEALKRVLGGLPGNLPPICIVQHIPAQFSGAFANRLNSMCAMEVREARHGEELAPGLALLAPGGKHLLVKWTGSNYVALLNEGPPVHHQRPAVDVLFDSVVKAGGAGFATSALLTGMGRDGAQGMLNLRENGAGTIAQSERTCVVFGMPREAIALGAAQETLDLQDIDRGILRLSRRSMNIDTTSVGTMAQA